MEERREEGVDVGARQASVLLASSIFLLTLLGFCPTLHSLPPPSLCLTGLPSSVNLPDIFWNFLFDACLLPVLFAVINLFLYYGVLGGLYFILENSLQEEIK